MCNPALIFYLLLTVCYCIEMNINNFNDANVSWVWKKCNKGRTTVMGNWTNNKLNILQSICRFNTLNLVGFEVSDYLKTASYNLTKRYRLDASDKLFQPRPSSNFIFIDFDLHIFKLIIHKIRDSIWWNKNGNFFIVNTVTSYTCTDAYAHLKIIWEFDVLKATYLCGNGNGNFKLYTFNPFTDYAPHPWTQVHVYYQNNGHPFVLFEMPLNFKNLSGICDVLHFERTMTLGGYPIRIVGSKSYHPIDPTKVIKIRGYEAIISEMIWKKLNATVIFSIQPYDKMGFINRYGFPTDTLKDVLHGKYDTFMNFRIDDKLWKNQFYVYGEIKTCSVSVKHLLSLNERVLKTFTLNFTIMCAIAFLGATIAFMFLETRTSFSRAALNLFNTLLGYPIPIRLTFVSVRIIFVIFLFFGMIVSSYFQSKLYSAVTVPQYGSLVTSDQDLVDWNYQIISKEVIRTYYYSHSVLSNRTKIVKKNIEYLDFIKKRENVALITTCHSIAFDFDTFNFHLTELDNFGKYLHVFTHRDNFFLRKRLYQIFQRIQESGILLYQVMHQLETNHKMENSTHQTNKHFFDEVTFAYSLFIRGLLFSSLIFLIELIVRVLRNVRLCLWIKRVIY